MFLFELQGREIPIRWFIIITISMVYLKSDQDYHRLVGRRRLLGIANSKNYTGGIEIRNKKRQLF